MNSIGERLAEERKRLGMDQERFGEIGGVKRNAQLAYEKNRRPLNTDYLELIRQAGADVVYIVTGQKPSELRLYEKPEDALMTVINVQSELGVNFDADQLKALLGLTWSLQLSQEGLREVVLSGYDFHGVERPGGVEKG